MGINLPEGYVLDSPGEVAKAPPGYVIDTPEPGFGENVARNLGENLNPINIVKGIGSQIKTGLYDFPKQVITDSANATKNIAGVIAGNEDLEMPHIPLQEMVTEHPLVKDPAKFVYENPVDAAMLALVPLMGLKGLMGKKPPVALPEASPVEPIQAPPVAPKAPVKAPSPEAPTAPPPITPANPLADVKQFVSDKLKADPLKDVRDYVKSKTQKIEANPGWPTKAAKYLKEEATNWGAKDLGLQMRQVQSMGPGFKGLEKAQALIDYAREKGYLDPTLSDVSRKEKIIQTQTASGKQMDAIRNIAERRAPAPFDAIKVAVEQELQAKYGAGVEKSTAEIKNVMDELEKARPTFTGMSELATKLNKSATKVKDLGQHPGPTTDAANIVSRLNNEAIRNVLNPQEAKVYTESLRDYGANKKLEQAVSGAERRKMTARTNQRGIFGRMFQEALDRGGYRIAGNTANKVAETILKNPGKIKTLPEFFEELAHTSDDVLDDALGIGGMSAGGVVPEDIAEYVRSR